MKNYIQLNSIRQGVWTDQELILLKEKIRTIFQMEISTSTQSTIKITNHLLQRLALLTGLSRKGQRDLEKIEEIKLKAATYFETTFHSNEIYPLLTALLKLHYQKFNIDWNNSIETSKIINYEMEEGVKILLNSNQLKEMMSYES